jgi:type III pantothenate kinase
MTILAIDLGNSRIKWGFRHGGEWLSLGALPKANAAQLAGIWSDQPPPTRILGCNVAGVAWQQQLESAVAMWGMRVEWVATRQMQCGVVNCYDDPVQLGTDRWIAMIAAWHRLRESRRGCIVMSVGTAVTIDALTSSGEFIGGVIIPSPHVMAESLESSTAALKRVPGRFHLPPTNTADAIATGGYIAVGGALWRMERALKVNGDENCDVVLTGGGAADLQPTLERQVTLIPNLLLEGLVVVSGEKA